MGDLSLLSVEMHKLSTGFWSARVPFCPDFDEQNLRPISARVPRLDLEKLKGVCLDITVSLKSARLDDSRSNDLLVESGYGSNRTLEFINFLDEADNGSPLPVEDY